MAASPRYRREHHAQIPHQHFQSLGISRENHDRQRGPVPQPKLAKIPKKTRHHRRHDTCLTLTSKSCRMTKPGDQKSPTNPEPRPTHRQMGRKTTRNHIQPT
ncbi:hypothetical protein NQ314_005508 [Rhamnusium bicolor]|uniref:Uncharacterized protein n=1 Tax=Rhamnusium bicolor TaxID=1586634 RepID=A0AAV8ZJL5_9CUCU|nr:hypothetical protein NQ314_005508 [Rhamnusium bicolor]